MDAATTRALATINARFYRLHAGSFSATRQRAWPGWQRMVEALPPTVGPVRVLDAGCGNARLVPYLRQRLGALSYLGVDRELGLLADARHRVRAGDALAVVDLMAHGLDAVAPGRRFDFVALFSVLHHLPGHAARASLLRRLAGRLAGEGRLAVTFWRFAGAPEFARRQLTWRRYNETAAEPIDERSLEAGDHLLTWNGDTAAPRYCHHADDDEIEALVAASGLAVIDAFDADGHRGEGNRYLVLARPD